MIHINDFTIQGFRGLRNLKIEKLGPVNLFVGNNNSGKTSVLEAASIFCDPLNSRKWYDVGSQRELSSASRSSVDRLRWFFSGGSHDHKEASLESAKIQMSAVGNFPIEFFSAFYEEYTEIMKFAVRLPTNEESLIPEEIEREIESIRIHVSVTPRAKYRQLTLLDEEAETAIQDILTFSDQRFTPVSQKQRILTIPAQIVNPFTHRTSGLTSQLWSEVVEADLKMETINLLQFFDPAIEDVDLISPTERRQLISIKHKELGRAPLYTFGDGLRRVFTLATTIPRVRGGLLLIDELETAIHTKALEKTFGWLVNACAKNDVQLFATTHSLEALDTLLEVSREQSDLVVYRLQQEKEQTAATRFSKEMTLQLRQELGMEMRY